jgi:cell division protein FtsZ
MGIGKSAGENRAVEAARAAINSPLLDISIDGAKGILFAIAGDKDMTMFEIQEAAKVIIESIDPNARVIFGAFHDEKLNKNEIKVTVIASGFPDNIRRKPLPNSELRGESETPLSAPAAESESKPAGKKAEPVATKTLKPLEDEEDEDWSSIPAFLRRSKK